MWKSAKHTLVIVAVVAADNEKKNSIDWRKQTDKQSFRQSYIYFCLKQVRTIKNVHYITIMSWLLSVCTSISTYQLLSIYLHNINKKSSLNHNLMSWLLTTSSNLPTSWFTLTIKKGKSNKIKWRLIMTSNYLASYSLYVNGHYIVFHGTSNEIYFSFAKCHAQ